jgi:enoyl-CoA hydratase/carnithine racemase
MMAPLLIETAANVTTLAFNRPAQRNALSRELLESLRTALAIAAADKVSAIILTGETDCFSAGADISELDGTPNDLRFDEALGEIVNAVQNGPFLVIAAIEGACVGAAFDLACACDARVVSSTAFFELPAVRFGLLYNPAAVARIQRVMPSATVRRLLLMGERIDASQSIASGIATHLVEKSHALGAAREIGKQALINPRALTETKRLLAAFDQGLTDLSSWQAVRRELLGSAERKAAVKSAKSRLHS